MNAKTIEDARQALQNLSSMTLQLLRLQALGKTADYTKLVQTAAFSDCPTFAQMDMFRQIVGEERITIQLLDAQSRGDTNQYITLLDGAAFSDTPVFAQQEAYNSLMERANLKVV